MNESLIGKMIKEYRERLGISQEELCDGMCAVSTLSRLEAGKHLPGRKQIEVFFERLGMDAPVNLIPMTQQDFEKHNLEVTIENMVAQGTYDIELLLNEYKIKLLDTNIFENQFFMLFSGICSFHGKKAYNDCLERFKQALCLTMPRFTLDVGIQSKFLSGTELMLVNNIALTLYELGDIDGAIRYMDFLKTYFESGHISEVQKSKNYSVILYNLTNWKGQQGKHDEAVKLATLGIEACKKYGKLFYFPYHIFNKGYAQCMLGNIMEGKQNIADAFTIMKQLGWNDNVEYGKKQVKDTFGLNL